MPAISTCKLCQQCVPLAAHFVASFFGLQDVIYLFAYLLAYFDKCVVCGCQQLPKFYFLCEDSIWGVRKACAECFAQVSTVCSPAVRRAELSQLFINLIYDQSRWVYER